MTKARDLANIISGGFTADDIPNLDAAKITSGTFADARIAASNVSQHATSFDDNKLVNDISTLALRQASNENKAAYNTNSMYVDVFQDATGITGLSNATRNDQEFISTVTAASNGTLQNFVANNWNNGTLGSYSQGDGTFSTDGTPDEDGLPHTRGATSELNFAANTPFQISGVMNSTGSNGHGPYIVIASESNTPSSNPSNDSAFHYNARYTNSSYFIRVNAGNPNNDKLIFQHKDSGGTESTIVSASDNVSVDNTTVLIERDGNGIITLKSNGVLKATGTLALTSKVHIALGSSGGNAQNFSISSFQYSIGTAAVANATGSFQSNAITAPSSISSMGAVITYQDNAGTNTLNTDLILKLSADGGSNFSTATLTALPDFATGIKMAKVNDLSVTAGTSLKYKLEFANQALGSKEARIRGVSLQY